MMQSDELTKANWRYGTAMLIAIVVVALVVRLYGINFALPQWDEYGTFNEAFFALNKQFAVPAYEHGSLLPYLVLLVWYPFGTYLQGSLPDPYQLLVMYHQNPIAFAMFARMLSVLASTATVVATYFCAMQLYNRAVGLLAGFFLAFTFLHVAESHYIRSYALVTFFATLAVYYCAKLLDNGRQLDYILAGIFVGLATAAQYSGILLLLPLLLGHMLRIRRSVGTYGWIRRALFSRPLVIALDMAGLVFFLTTPYALLDLPRFASTVKLFVLHGQSVMPQVSSEGQPIWLFYLTEHLAGGMGAGLELAAIAGLIYLLYRHRNQDAALIVFPLLLLGTLNDSVNFARYAVPLLPFLAISAAVLLDDLSTEMCRRLQWRSPQLVRVPLAVILVIPSALNIARFDFWITQPDTRLIAAQWIESNVPAGRSIVVEGAGVLGPPVPMDRDTLNERIANEPADSLEALNARALRATLFPGPAYRLTAVARIDERIERGALVGFVPDAHTYADAGIEYLTTVNWMMRTEQDKYAPAFQQSLEALYEPVVQFRPTILFKWDPYAWRIDYSALAQVLPGHSEVGGPILTIYRRIGSK